MSEEEEEEDPYLRSQRRLEKGIKRRMKKQQAQVTYGGPEPVDENRLRFQRLENRVAELEKDKMDRARWYEKQVKQLEWLNEINLTYMRDKKEKYKKRVAELEEKLKKMEGEEELEEIKRVNHPPDKYTCHECNQECSHKTEGTPAYMTLCCACLHATGFK